MESNSSAIFTIVTPSFQHGEFIRESLQSVFNQAGNFYIDFRVMDGGSKDQTVDILREFESSLAGAEIKLVRGDRKFRKAGNTACLGISYTWVSKPDGGQVMALIEGFKEATGEFLGWLNSDDIFLHSRVLEEARIAFSDDIDCVTADGLFVDRQAKEIGPHRVSDLRLKELLYLDYHILQPSTFFRRKVYEEIGLDNRFTCIFDAYFFTKSILKNHKWKKLAVDWSGFRIYPDIKTIKLAQRRFEEQIIMGRELAPNPIYRWLSIPYRYLEIVKKPLGFSPRIQKLFYWLRESLYRLILKQSQR